MKQQCSLNASKYRDRIFACFLGKNIGGTLGAPFEGTTEMLNLDYYPTSPAGSPLPNDDLDLQLVWLKAVEDHGLYHINEQLLGEYWLSHIIGPWNEYGIGKFNMCNGLPPPLSGVCNNEKWKNSNGAWIRSEIWACLMPGAPAEAVRFAWYDSCVDHADEGIYAEQFIVALEAAAFVENNIQTLIEIALSYIPPECRVAQSVKLVEKRYKENVPWRQVREEIVKFNADMGFFQAPGNVAFVVIGLLYGNGDFSSSVCIAVNCGDDTDCTGATCGSIMGILLGTAGIPEKWSSPIGEKIVTISLNTYLLDVPATLTDLTDRVYIAKLRAELDNPDLPHLAEDENIPVAMDLKASDKEMPPDQYQGRMCKPLEIHQSCSWGTLHVEYNSLPVLSPGESIRLSLGFTCNQLFFDNIITLQWLLPETWSIAPSPIQNIRSCGRWMFRIETEITAGEFADGPVCHIPIKIRISGRNYDTFVTIPFQQKNTVSTEEVIPVQKSIEHDCRQNAIRKYWESKNPTGKNK
ncbi:MAG: ADP-ribosylglycohydrolase family protein [Lentisphaeria bacterium]|nr:ADP-ribosylglycohydrolase family protein [Lentisphaeria bacterium]